MAQTHGNTAASKLINAPRSRSFSGPFGRLFRELPPWEPKGDSEVAHLDSIEKIAAQMGPQNPAANNKSIPAGYTYFGQFIDHDLTFDPRSSLQKHNDPESLEDFRSPAFDLDCIYGRGPDDQPYMYAQSGDPDFKKGMLRWDKSNVFGEPDLARIGPAFSVPTPLNLGQISDADKSLSYLHRAVIGDKRNDENTFVSQLQLTFIKFHNAVLDQLTDGGPNSFAEAQRLTRWHYQWVVIHDWLKRLCGAELVDAMLCSGDCPGKPKLCYYNPHEHPFMPVEFSVAAYRLGHSMVRGRYSINKLVGPNNNPRGLPTFDGAADTNPLGDFRGFRPLPRAWTVDWSFMLQFKNDPAQQPQLQFSSPLDKSLAQALIAMPTAIADPDEVPSNPPTPPTPPPNPIKRSLAYRNLLRSWRFCLPSGEAVARHMGIDISGNPASESAEFSAHGDTPQWRYILDEAAAAPQNGEKLGPVGSRIVAETFIGLLAADPSSYYRVHPNWTPDARIPVVGDGFQLRDIVNFAGARVEL